MNTGGSGNGQLTVPPGFRFHPTDEELLYYYLRKKVSFEAIDLDVIREIDLNKLEPWDLKEKCRIGSGPQNEWYFFSHKDKKYPTGTRTNRATAAGFWKATGRDKAIHLSDAKRIGMRKTLVFYTGRAPHGHKTDWIMHEYRLDDADTNNSDHVQEDGWVVCRVFKKKNHIRGNCNGNGGASFHQEIGGNINNQDGNSNIPYINNNMNPHMKASAPISLEHHHQQALYDHHHHHNNTSISASFDASMHLPQLFTVPDEPSSVPTPLNLHSSHHNLLTLTSVPLDHRPFNGGDWTFLDKLLNNNNSHHHNNLIHHHQAAKCHPSSSSDHLPPPAASTQTLFPFQYLGCDTDILKFNK